MNTNFLQYPKRSHRKIIKFPRNSVLLAEFMGIQIGDGGINNPWQVVITLNSNQDAIFAQYVIDSIYRLFGIHAAVRKRKNKNALQIVSSSVSLIDFLLMKGAVSGDKVAQRIDVPEWIRRKGCYERAFVRGLIDTDGCLYIHRHITKGIFYKNIGLCFTSGSEPLLNSVANIFQKYNIKPHITDENRRIYLYNKDAVLRYLRIFGSSNPRIIEKFKEYKKWKGAGVA